MNPGDYVKVKFKGAWRPATVRKVLDGGLSVWVSFATSKGPEGRFMAVRDGDWRQ